MRRRIESQRGQILTVFPISKSSEDYKGATIYDVIEMMLLHALILIGNFRIPRVAPWTRGEKLAYGYPRGGTDIFNPWTAS